MKTLLTACLAVLLAGTAHAEDRLRLDISSPGGRDYQVAIQRFETLDPDAAELRESFYRDVVEAIEFSGVLKSLPPKAFLGPKETVDYESRYVPCDDWRGVGADALVQGRLERSRGRVHARFRVWDTVRCTLQGNPTRFDSGERDVKLLARRLADEVVLRFTGKRGVSATQIAFVSDKSGNKEVYVMEADGSNKRKITANGSINLFPSWSPEGDTLLYTSYRGGSPDVWMVSRGKRRNGQLLGKKALIKYRGVWAPRDGHIALVMNHEANTDIFAVRENGRGLRRLTYGRSIETSPSWSPDETKMAFVSDRTGSPQVYVRDMGSGETRRLTYEGSYNVSPAWSPSGEWVAYAAQQNGGFDIHLIDPESGYSVPVVVHPRADEEPHWSPDGRKLVFTSTRRGRKEVFVIDIIDPVTSIRRLTRGFGHSSNAAWSPWLE